MSPGASVEREETRDQASRLRALIEAARAKSPPERAGPAAPQRAGAEPPPPREDDDSGRQRLSLGALKSLQSASTRPQTPVALKPPPSVRAPLREGWGDPASASQHSRRNGAAEIGTANPVIIAVASGKGGVGKTTLCVNLGVALARRGVRCALIDGDIGLANADLLCGVRAGRNLGHVLAGECSLREALTLAPGGFLLAAGASALGAGNGAAPDRIISGTRGLGALCDAALIDCGAGASETVLRFLTDADHRLIVCTPEPASIADAYAVLKRLVALERERSGDSSGRRDAVAIVVNQALDAADARRAFARIESVAQRFLSAPPSFLGWLPRDHRLAESVRRRSPVALRSRRAPSSRAIARLAGRLIEQANVHPRARRPWPRRLLARIEGLGGLRRARLADRRANA